MKNFFWLIVTVLITLPWIFLELTGRGHSMNPALVSVISGVAIVGAAFLLSWGAELSERDIPRSLALIALALISVLPEYAVDLHFAWQAGKDPEYKAFAVANMTGANRVLIGLGWSLVAVVYYFKYGRKEIPIDRSQGLELSLLLLATLYSLVIPLKGTLSWVDILVFFAMFLYYAGRAARGETHDEDLGGIAGAIDRRLGNGARRAVVLVMFAYAGYAIWLSAEPFAEGLVSTGRSYHIDEFLLVQWLAPFASESPEAIIALLFALKGKGSTGLGALISSKINQWTLLVGAIPLVYAVSKGGLVAMDLDHRQKEELLLTSAQSLFAAVIISDFSFALWEALLLLILFLAQLLLPDENVRFYFSLGYLILAVALLAASKTRRAMLWRALTLKG
ncbi:MAG TPA: sodium:calcium antiporter [Blastocatellia bacterium]|nr:sodium:calcium antiporter [Blastocatellia bacterium]